MPMSAASRSIRRDAGPISGDGACACPSRNRPIDLVHLAAQTLGDRMLEREVLELLDRQLLRFSDRLDRGNADERRQIAHAVLGAARNVGAFRLAAAAERLENDRDEQPGLDAFRTELRDAREFIRVLRAD